jgi:hypothetical protein
VNGYFCKWPFVNKLAKAVYSEALEYAAVHYLFMHAKPCPKLSGLKLWRGLLAYSFSVNAGRTHSAFAFARLARGSLVITRLPHIWQASGSLNSLSLAGLVFSSQLRPGSQDHSLSLLWYATVIIREDFAACIHRVEKSTPLLVGRKFVAIINQP